MHGQLVRWQRDDAPCGLGRIKVSPTPTLSGVGADGCSAAGSLASASERNAWRKGAVSKLHGERGAVLHQTGVAVVERTEASESSMAASRSPLSAATGCPPAGHTSRPQVSPRRSPVASTGRPRGMIDNTLNDQRLFLR